MRIIEGIHTVEVKINGSGYGVVNWNGNDTSSKYDNHLLPKMRTNRKSGDKHVYVSSNCTRHHLFRDEGKTIAALKAGMVSGELTVKSEKLTELFKQSLSSIIGLVRGYMYTAKGGQSYGRKTALLMEDLQELEGNETTAEICTSAWAVDKDGNRDSNSLFYRHSLGDTSYEGYAAIDIEGLQFISLDNTLGNAAVPINPKKGDQQIEDLIESINDYLARLCTRLNVEYPEPPAVTAGRYRRINNLLDDIEFGLLLNQSAIDVLVLDTLRRLSELKIAQGKGFLAIETVSVLLNKGRQAMSIKKCDHSSDEIVTPSTLLKHEKQREYAVYFEPVD